MLSPAAFVRFVTLAAITLTACGLVLLPLPATATVATEAAIKAAYLYNFGLFVEWPSAVFPAADSPFTICVVGNDPFGATLDATVNGQKIRDHPIAVRRLGSLSRNSGCQIAYFASDGPPPAAAANSDVLTVSDDATNNDQAGIINFIVMDGRVRFTINEAAAAQSGLTVSSRLLNLAVAVKPRP